MLPCSSKSFFCLLGIFLGYSFMSLLIFSFLKPNFVNKKESGTENLLPLNTLGEKLYKEVRILCWVLSNPATFRQKDEHIKRTWGKRCNKLLFMGSASNDSSYDAIRLNVPEGRENLYQKSRAAFKYVYDNHLDEADWFMKADDNTYVVPENLRYLLYQYSPEMPIYFGQIYKEEGYMAGGAGYVLSKESLTRLVKEGINKNVCPLDQKNEDASIGSCLRSLGGLAGDARDEKLRERFFQFQPDVALLPQKPEYSPGDTYEHYSFIWYDYKFGQNSCCSDTFIAAHQITPQEMYLYEYLIHKVKIFGESNQLDELPRKISYQEVLDKFDGKVVNNGL